MPKNNFKKGFIHLGIIILVLAGLTALAIVATQAGYNQTRTLDKGQLLNKLCRDDRGVGHIFRCPSPSPYPSQPTQPICGDAFVVPNHRPVCPSPSPTPPVCAQQDGVCCDTSLSEVTFCPPPPSPTPKPVVSQITNKVGEQEGSFLIQKIKNGSVEGLWYQRYPSATDEGTPKTLHKGDDIGYACEGVSEKLTNINFARQTVTFTKVVLPPPPGGCPI